MIPGLMPTVPSTCVKLACSNLFQCTTLPDPFRIPIRINVKQCVTLDTGGVCASNAQAPASSLYLSLINIEFSNELRLSLRATHEQLHRQNK